MIQIIKISRELLTSRERWRTAASLALAIFVAVLETLSLGVLIPVLLKMMSGAEIAVPEGFIASLFDHFETVYKNYGIEGASALIAGLYLAKNVIVGYAYRYQIGVAYGISRRMSVSLLGAYLTRPYEFFLRTDPSLLTRNVYSEVGRFVGGVYLPALVIFSELVVALFLLALLLRIELFGGLIFFGVLISAFLCFRMLTKRRLATYGEMRQHADYERLRYLTEAFKGIKELKVYGLGTFFERRHDHFVKQSCEAASYQTLLQHVPRLSLEVFALAAILIFLVILQQSGDPNQQQFFKVSLYVAAAFRLLPAATKAIAYAQLLRFEWPAARELRIAFRESAVALPLQSKRPPATTRTGFSKLELESIGFRYNASNGTVFSGVCLAVESGDFIGIVGGSGSGKSTLLNIITGLLEPSEGCLLVDGRDVRISEVLHFAYAPQAAFIIDDSILRNIALDATDPDEATIWRVLEIVQLRDYVASLPGGLSYRLGSSGTNFSGGQQQRIGIARALYVRSDVLVLDEATSALDGDTERALLQAYVDSEFFRTTVFVTHRDEVLRHCNKVLRLDQDTPTTGA